MGSRVGNVGYILYFNKYIPNINIEAHPATPLRREMLLLEWEVQSENDDQKSQHHHQLFFHLLIYSNKLFITTLQGDRRQQEKLLECTPFLQWS